MRVARRYLCLVVQVLIIFIVLGPAVHGLDSGGEVELWFFWGDGCDLCDAAMDWLDELTGAYPEMTLHSVEVWHDGEGEQLYRDMMAERGLRASWVPGFILGDETWEGFNDVIAADIESEVEHRLGGPIYGGRTGDPPAPSTPVQEEPPGTTLQVGPLGAVQVEGQSLLGATLLIALVDGFNPCSLWVLTILLAMILNTPSRARIAAVGGIFLLTTAAIYGLFIAGLFSALAAARHLAWIRFFVATLALVVAAVNIKDYFAFGKGFSLTIPDRLKPAIFRGGREVRKERTLPMTLAITVAFAAGVALIELPCTAGFPAIWSGLVNEAGVAFPGFLTLLAVYLAVYLMIEVAIVIAALVTLRISRFQEVHGRTLKLVGGTVMAAIAVALIADPVLMEGFMGSVYIIGGGLLAAALVMIVQRIRQAGEKPSDGSEPDARPPR